MARAKAIKISNYKYKLDYVYAKNIDDHQYSGVVIIHKVINFRSYNNVKIHIDRLHKLKKQDKLILYDLKLTYLA